MYCEVEKIEVLEEEGTRVCLDFIDYVREDEGVYVGNTGQGYLMIMAETTGTTKYMPRPFRINCGAVHQYLYSNEKTFYLSDINSGNKIEIFSNENKRNLVVGRVKMEKRKFVMVFCKKNDIKISATLQFVESVYLSGENERICVMDLKVGDRIKCFLDTPGRHLGDKIAGFIIEK